MSARWGYALALAFAIGAFAILLKLPGLDAPHDERDEIVYWSVAQNLLERGSYSLRGTAILPQLSARIYDRPLFHHPPLFPCLLVPFVALDAPRAAVSISWLGHALCILAVGLIGRAVALRDGTTGVPVELLWIPLLGTATDPLLTHVSRKLWIDSLLAGLVALAIALAYLAPFSRRRRLVLGLAGLALGIAGLAKLTGLLAAPIVALVIWSERGSIRERTRDLAIAAIPCALLVLPWIAVFFATYGVVTPNWLEPDEFAVRNYPLVAAAVGRSWYYYGLKLVLSQPVVLVALAFACVGKRGGSGLARWVPLAWFAVWLVAPTLQSAGGYGYQMRYIVPIVPSIYVMLYSDRLAGGRFAERWMRPLVVLLLTYAAIGSAYFLLAPRFDELLSFFELGGLLSL